MINPIDKILDTSNFDFDWVELNLSPAQEFIYRKFMESKLITGSDSWTRYFDPNGKVIFMDNIETNYEEKILYFSYDEIYKKLIEIGLSYIEMRGLIKDMLWETHKRKVDMVTSNLH